jgi:hypothetical protein
LSYCSLAQIGSPVHSMFKLISPLVDIESEGGSLSTIIPASNRHSINASRGGMSVPISPVRRTVRRYLTS